MVEEPILAETWWLWFKGKGPGSTAPWEKAEEIEIGLGLHLRFEQHLNAGRIIGSRFVCALIERISIRSPMEDRGVKAQARYPRKSILCFLSLSTI